MTATTSLQAADMDSRGTLRAPRGTLIVDGGTLRTGTLCAGTLRTGTLLHGTLRAPRGTLRHGTLGTLGTL